MARILITGGAGFIGSNLVASLQNKHEICIVDNFQTSTPTQINSIVRSSDTTLIQGNICDPEVIKNLQDLAKFDYIIHLACPASPPKYQLNQFDTLETNYIGTKNILQLALELNARVVLASTSEIYGDPLSSPQVEDYRGNVNTTGPRSCYDEGKRILETLGYIFRSQFGLDVGIVRIFNTYGPYMHIDDGRVVTAFIKNLLEDKPLEIFGDGTQTRSLCYVSDLVEGLISYLFSDTQKTMNLGNDREVSVNELAEIICNIAQKKKLTIYKSLPQDDPVQRCPDLSRANKHLKWKPKIELETGLKQTYEFFQKKYETS